MAEDERPKEIPISKRPRPAYVASAEPRDPRFDPRCNGKHHEKIFSKNYSFLDEVRQQEIRKLQDEMNKERDPDRKVRIKSTISRLKNKIVEKKNKDKTTEIVHEMKSSKRYKNSDIKKQVILEKYKELKESGKLTKYLERKRKKLLKKDSTLLS